MDTFLLHNRVGSSGDSISMTSLEESARDRKNQLEGIFLQLKKMITHLSLITDERVSERDVMED
jgi:hypothetical protein